MKLKTTTQLFANLSNGNSYSLNLASINLFKILIFSLSILVNAKTSAQTTIFSDNFGSSTGASYDITGAIGSSSSWSLTSSGVDWGAKIDGGLLTLTNDASATTNASTGWIYGYSDFNTLSGWNTTLSSNTSIISWEFNMQQARTDPAGFSSGSYGVAFIISSTTSTNVATTGSGYAIVLGQSGTTDAIRFCSFNNGLQGTLTDLITSNTSGLTDFGANYTSVKVSYTPTSNKWEFFLRNDGASTFSDPSSGTLVSQGTVVDNTYTSTSGMRYIGGYWQGANAATQTAFFDNVKVTSTPACTAPTAQPTNLVFSSITTTSLTGSFSAATGSGSNYLVVRTTTNSAPTNPSNLSLYTAGSSDLGGYIEYSGSNLTWNSSGLTSGTTYYWWVFSYNYTAGTCAPNYYTTSPLNSPATTTTSTTGNSSITVPTCVSYLTVQCWGGGGAGSGTGGGSSGLSGAGCSSSGYGNGGAGGSYSNKTISVTSGSSYNYTVGVGGTAGSNVAPGGAGGAGGSTFFGNSSAGNSTGSSVIAVGGVGGAAGSSSTTSLGSTSGSLGDVMYKGGDGAAKTGSSGGGGGAGSGSSANGASASSGTGGTGANGGGTGANAGATNGSAGTQPGGGGSGGTNSSATCRSGGAGGAGQISITYNYPSMSTSASLSAFTSCSGIVSTAQSFTITGSYISSSGITVTAPTGYEVSTTSSTSGFASSINIAGASSISATVWVRLTSSASGSPTGNLVCSNSCLSSQNIAVSGTVSSCSTPTVTVSTNSLSAFSSCANTASSTTTFTVSGSNLGSNNLVVTAPTGFELLQSGGASYASTYTLTPSSGTVGSTTMTVRMSAQASSPTSANITCASSGATTQNVAVSGTVNPVISGNTSGSAVSICSGATTTLTGGTVSGGNSSYTYLWESSSNNSTWANAAGTYTGTTYTTAALSSATYFRRTVTSGSCSDVAASILVSINALPTAVTVSTAGTYCTSTTLTASGGSGGTIYWQGTTNGGTSTSGVSGVTSPSITSTGTYYANAQSSAGCWGTQGSAAVTINTAVLISAHPSLSAQSQCQSGTAFTALTVTASGTSLTYQWQQSTDGSTGWTSVTAGTGGTTNSYTPSNASVGTLYFRCVVSGASPCSSANSNSSAAITVNASPTISSQPSNSSILQGNSTTFSVGTSASSPTYQWQYSADGSTGWASVANATPSGFTYSGSTGLTLTVSTSSSAPAVVDYYRCVVTSNGCSTNSSNGTLTLTGYCTPSSTSSSTYISNFSTTSGLTNISNLSSGYSTSGYGNFSSTISASQYASSAVNFSLTLVGGTAGIGIWIDWNDNGLFTDLTESVYNSAAYMSTGITTGSFTVPSGAAIGSHRMRVIVDYSGTTPTSCVAATSSRGEAEDYTFTVVALALPTITSFTPSSGCVSTGTITITGTNFTGTPTVSIGGTAATGVIVNSSTSITATVGNGTTGTVSVTTLGGTATSSSTYTVNPLPTLSYSGSPYTYSQNTAISTLTPTLGNSPTTFSVSPALPSGISLNTSTGVISGTPSSPQVTASYTITASNSNCSGTTSISINILPSNDLCASSTTLTVDASASTGSLENSNFTSPFTSYNDVWYQFTPSCTSNHTITLTGFTNDKDLAVFSACGTTTTLNSSTGTSTTESITQSFTSSTTYYIRVYDYSGTGGSFTISVTGDGSTAPTVTNPSTGSQNVCLNGGTFAQLSVTGSGIGISYQWQESANGASGWANVSSSGTSSTYTPSNSVVGTKYFRCIVTNCAGSATSNASGSMIVSSTPSAYYSASTGNLNSLSSWGSNTDGTGCSPVNFTTASITYYITNRTTATIGAAWTVSGASSKVVLGQASAAAVTFTIPNNYAFTGTIDIAAASSGSNTLVINNTSIPTFGTLNAASTVKYNAANSQTISVATYGNLETGVESGTSNYTKTVAGILDINGNLTIGDYTILNLSTYSHTLAGHMIKASSNSTFTATAGTITFDGTSIQHINVVDPTTSTITPCDADISFGNIIINGSNVCLWYNKTTDKKINIVDFTVNNGKSVKFYSGPAVP